MQTKLSDHVHYFDCRGASTLSYDYLVAENERLLAEVARLTRLIEAQRRKILAIELDSEPRPIIN